MSQALCRKAFETTLKTWADAQTPAIPIAWQNVAFTPPVGRYVRAHVLPADTGRIALDGSGKSFRGIFQVSFVMPIGVGSGTVEGLVASLDAAFASSITTDGVRVYLLTPFGAASAMQEGDRYVVPVSARYMANVI